MEGCVEAELLGKERLLGAEGRSTANNGGCFSEVNKDGAVLKINNLDVISVLDSVVGNESLIDSYQTWTAVFVQVRRRGVEKQLESPESGWAMSSSFLSLAANVKNAFSDDQTPDHSFVPVRPLDSVLDIFECRLLPDCCRIGP
jgi:hypothetical protein